MTPSTPVRGVAETEVKRYTVSRLALPLDAPNVLVSATDFDAMKRERDEARERVKELERGIRRAMDWTYADVREPKASGWRKHRVEIPAFYRAELLALLTQGASNVPPPADKPKENEG